MMKTSHTRVRFSHCSLKKIELEVFKRQLQSIRDSPVEISEATNLEVVEIGKIAVLKASKRS